MAITSLRGYGGQNVMQLMRNESSSDSLVAMLGSCSSHVGLQALRSDGGLEDAVVGCGQKRPYNYGPSTYDGPTVEEAEDGDEGGDDCSPHVEKKRRLTFDQVRSLEKNFDLENKLEPERKMQLAKELGLQPRQVAVWFQNRRARWKTKQLERDYEVLSLDYNRLKADLEVVLREKDNLKAEVQRLSGNARDSEPKQGYDHSAEPAHHCTETTATYPSQAVQAEIRDSDLAGSMWSHHHSRSSPTIDVSLASRKEIQEDLTACSDSNSSDVLDADSPRTSDSCSPSTMSPGHHHDQQLQLQCPQFPPESFNVGPNMLQVSDDLCNTPQLVFQRSAVKLEDGPTEPFHEDQSCCNYFLPQLDVEQSVLPWWDWP